LGTVAHAALRASWHAIPAGLPPVGAAAGSV